MLIDVPILKYLNLVKKKQLFLYCFNEIEWVYFNSQSFLKMYFIR